jgi:hypothetical protein
MDSLKLVGANDNVRDRRAVVKDEDCAFVSCVSICVASTSAVEFFVAVVDGAGDDGGCGERDDGAGARGDVEGLGGREGCQGGEEGGCVEHGGGWAVEVLVGVLGDWSWETLVQNALALSHLTASHAVDIFTTLSASSTNRARKVRGYLSLD